MAQNRSTAVMQRRKARELGLPRYFTGKPCSQGHIAERWTSCKKCIDCNVVRSRESRLRNLEKRQATDRNRYHNNPLRKAYQVDQANRWWRENRGKKNATTARRRSWIRQATPAWLTEEQFAEIQGFYQRAAAYGIDVMHVDHVVPLRGENVCGLHVPWNLQIITADENRAKGNRCAE